jgi:hypothetical protein
MPQSSKSYEERLADLEKREEALKEEKKRLIAKHKADERKKDAHEKILLGASVKAVLGRPYIDGDEQRLKEFLEKQERNGNFFTKAMNRNLPTPNTDSPIGQTDTATPDSSDETISKLNPLD